MEIYQLKVFLQVARYLSFTEAAKSLNLTQPAVSAKIKSLEADIGAPLFYRQGRKVNLTEIGHFLLEGAQDLVLKEEQLSRQLEDYKHGCRGEISLACSTAVSSGFISSFIFQFREQNPDINLRLMSCASSQEIYHAVTSSEVDIAISEISFADSSEVYSEAIASFDYGIVCLPNSRWTMKQHISLRETMGDAWVTNREDWVSRGVFESRLADLGLSVDDMAKVVIAETDSLMKTYILSGDYIGFTSRLNFQADIQAGQLAFLPLHEFALPSSLFFALSSKRFRTLQEHQQTVGHRHVESPLQKLLHLLKQHSTSVGNLEESSPEVKSTDLTMAPPAYTTSIRTIGKTEHLPIRIGIQNQTLPASTGGVVMKELGLLKHYLPNTGRYSSSHYDVQWQDFGSGMPIVNGLHSSQLDIGVLGDYPLLLSGLGQEETKSQQSQAGIGDRSTVLVGFVAVNPNGCRNAVIVPKHSKLKEIDDLRGQTLAIPDGSAAHGMVLRVLHQYDLLSDVELLPVQNSPSSRKIDRSIAGYAYFSPFHELALEQRQFRYLFDGNLSGLPAFYGVVARKQFAEEHPDLVVSYLKGLLAAQHWQSNIPSANQKLSKWTRSSTQLVNSIIGTPDQHSQGFYFPDSQIHEDWLSAHLSHYQSASNEHDFSTLRLNDWVDMEYMSAALNA